MARKLLILLFSFLSIVFVSSVNAQTATTGSIPTTVNSTAKLGPQVKLLPIQRKTATQAGEDLKNLIQAKRDEFKLKLQTIKDKRKQALVERIDARIAEINKNQTLRFIQTLYTIQTFLNKVGQSATGTATLVNITAAQAAIYTAKTAVAAQAAKSYVITITDDSTLKINVGTTVSQFRQDLVTVYKLVVDAKQAVQKLYTNKEIIKKEATGSAKL